MLFCCQPLPILSDCDSSGSNLDRWPPTPTQHDNTDKIYKGAGKWRSCPSTVGIFLCSADHLWRNLIKPVSWRNISWLLFTFNCFNNQCKLQTVKKNHFMWVEKQEKWNSGYAKHCSKGGKSMCWGLGPNPPKPWGFQVGQINMLTYAICRKGV